MTCDVQRFIRYKLAGHGDVNSRYVPTRVTALAGAAAAAAAAAVVVAAAADVYTGIQE